jgi:hypothetical protein
MISEKEVRLIVKGPAPRWARRVARRILAIEGIRSPVTLEWSHPVVKTVYHTDPDNPVITSREYCSSGRAWGYRRLKVVAGDLMVDQLHVLLHELAHIAHDARIAMNREYWYGLGGAPHGVYFSVVNLYYQELFGAEVLSHCLKRELDYHPRSTRIAAEDVLGIICTPGDGRSSDILWGDDQVGAALRNLPLRSTEPGTSVAWNAIVPLVRAGRKIDNIKAS